MKTKILKITGITLFILVSFIFATPWIFKGKIASLVKAEIKKNLRADVYFSNIDISLFRHFPKIAIGIDSLRVTCVGEFQGDTLITARQFDIACGLQSIISGDSIQVFSITVDEPRFHALTHKNGHANWNIAKSDLYPNETMDTSTRAVKMIIQHYNIHKGYLNYSDEKHDIHMVVDNLEQEGMGNFNADLFTLKTRTTADAIHFDINGAIPYRVTAKASINVSVKVENKSHTFSFNTDQVTFNDLKLHTEGFFQWINDSSYNMSIRFKAPSTNFKDILSMLPSVYQKDFASIETNGHVNLNGFIKGRYDEKHFPSFHTNLYVMNGFFKYPDLQVPVENINLGIQLDNPDGMTDHTTVNISEAHAEINHDTLNMHLFLKNLKSKPFIDFAFSGKLDLANISKCIKLEAGTQLTGLIHGDVYAKGKIPGSENHKKEPFLSGGNAELSNFLYISKSLPAGITLNSVQIACNPKNILIKEITGDYLTTHMHVYGSLNNFYDFALRNRPLSATLAVKADEFNLRDWIKANQDSSVAASVPRHALLVVPDNMNFNIHAEVEKLHYDNLDLQNLSGDLIIADQTIQLQDVKAKGLDGELSIGGTYSTLENKENPEIGLTYEVRGLDIQKTFLAFNTLRKIIPVAKFMAGNFNAEMILNGRLNNDLTTELPSLQGEGKIQLIAANLKDFGPMDKLSQSLDIRALNDIALTDVKADFAFKAGRVIVSPFLVHTKDMDLEINGEHGFDQSLNYGISLNVLRSQLGSKGSMFVKNVVEQAAVKGIPVKLNDAVCMNVKMSGSINNPDVKPDMDDVVDNAASDLKKEVNDFVNAKLDSARQELHKPPTSAKKSIYVQTANKSKPSVKGKKHTVATHKNSAKSKTKKKLKKPVKHYSTSLNKTKSTASNR